MLPMLESIGIVEYSHDAQLLGCLRSLVVSKVLRAAGSDCAKTNPA